MYLLRESLLGASKTPNDVVIAVGACRTKVPLPSGPRVIVLVNLIYSVGFTLEKSPAAALVGCWHTGEVSSLS
jgi:hypothetical protein